MRPSPLLHPLAVLRTTVGITQKQMGDFVNRAARTIQSIELGKLPLTEELALRIAEATGVDEAWLFAGDPAQPPVKGLTLVQAGRGEGEYTKADYEFHRAYLETAIWTEAGWTATKEKAKAKGNTAEVMQLGMRKLDVLERQKEIIELIDGVLTKDLEIILLKSKLTDDMRLVRWKIRRFLEDLAKEFALEIPKTEVNLNALKLAIPNPPLPATVGKPAGQRGHKAKR